MLRTGTVSARVSGTKPSVRASRIALFVFAVDRHRSRMHRRSRGRELGQHGQLLLLNIVDLSCRFLQLLLRPN